MLNSRIGQVLTRIDDLQARARFTERAYAIVAYLEQILREIYQVVETPVTPPPVTTPISSILPAKLAVPSRIDTNYLVIE